MSMFILVQACILLESAVLSPVPIEAAEPQIEAPANDLVRALGQD